MSVIIMAAMIITLTACGAGGGTDSSSAGEDEEVTLTLMVDSDETLDGLEAVCEKAKEAVGINVELDVYTAGSDGDNLVKTRLASGDMADLCVWSDSKFKSVGPEKYFIDLSDTDIPDKLDDTYKNAVTYEDGVYGIPLGTSMCGAVLYNREMYEKYNLEVPKTWDEFLDACEKIKAIGKTPLYYSGSDSWTLQCFTHFGFNKEVLDSGLTYTEFWNEMNTNKRHYSECQDFADAIVRSKEMIEKGYVQETYLSDSYDMAQTALAEGEAGMYVNDTGVIDEIASKYPDLVENIGAFPLPLYDEAEN